MSKVLVSIRVMPKDSNVDLDLLEKIIQEAISPEKLERKPIAFGIVAFDLVKVVEDKEGEIDLIENNLKSIELVGEVEVTEVSRVFI
mgnify:CR=1 FL=1